MHHEVTNLKKNLYAVYITYESKETALVKLVSTFALLCNMPGSYL
jgi:hypothetical protein